jgi:hypothetical protein
MKKIFLIAMAGISLALGIALIGCDQDGGGGGSSASSKTFTDGNYTLVIEKKSQQSQNALELPADTGVTEYSISSPALGDEFYYKLSNSGGIISSGTVKVTSTSTWSFASSSGGYTFTATFDGGSLKSFSGQVASGISGGQIGTLSPPATSKPGNSTLLAGTTWEGDGPTWAGAQTLQLTFTATTTTAVTIFPDGRSSSQVATYTLSGNTVTMNYQGQTVTATISGNKMTLLNVDGLGGTYTLTKVTSSTEDKTGGDDFTVTNAQVYQENETLPYTGSGTVKIGDLTVGSVTGGKLTYTLPATISNSYLMDIVSFHSSDVSVSNPNAKMLASEAYAANLYTGNTLIGGLAPMKTVGSTGYEILYWYFNQACSITGTDRYTDEDDGSVRTSTYSINASAGWNKIYVYGTQLSGTATTNPSNFPSDLKWVFASFGN